MRLESYEKEHKQFDELSKIDEVLQNFRDRKRLQDELTNIERTNKILENRPTLLPSEILKTIMDWKDFERFKKRDFRIPNNVRASFFIPSSRIFFSLTFF